MNRTLSPALSPEWRGWGIEADSRRVSSRNTGMMGKERKGEESEGPFFCPIFHYSIIPPFRADPPSSRLKHKERCHSLLERYA
jgi:hypothetical protein